MVGPFVRKRFLFFFFSSLYSVLFFSIIGFNSSISSFRLLFDWRRLFYSFYILVGSAWISLCVFFSLSLSCCCCCFCSFSLLLAQHHKGMSNGVNYRLYSFSCVRTIIYTYKFCVCVFFFCTTTKTVYYFLEFSSVRFIPHLHIQSLSFVHYFFFWVLFFVESAFFRPISSVEYVRNMKPFPSVRLFAIHICRRTPPHCICNWLIKLMSLYGEDDATNNNTHQGPLPIMNQN